VVSFSHTHKNAHTMGLYGGTPNISRGPIKKWLI